MSSYNAIYGSFAALPLFMLWIQISWLICLFGAELCYANQNMDDYAFKAKTEDLSHRYKMLLCLVLASRICRNFSEGAKPLSALKLKLATGIPIRIVNDLLYQLVQINILTEIPGGDKDGESLYQPAECITRLSVGTLIDRIEAQGKWSLTIDVKQLSSTAWKKIIAERNTYLNSQREVLLKDLSFPKQTSFQNIPCHVIMHSDMLVLIREKKLSDGSVNMALISPREIFLEALKDKAVSLILAHNHPSGDPTPSRSDRELTENVAKVGNQMDIPLLDHIIIGDNRYTSFREQKFLI